MGVGVTKDLETLHEVLLARYRRDAAALAAARAAEAAAAQTLAGMEAQARRALDDAGLPQHVIGAAALWQEEARRRRAALQGERAMARARVGEAEARLRASLGRAEGVAALVREAERERRTGAARRAEAETLARLILGTG